MVKFVANGEGDKPMLGLGLSEENVQRLKEGHPIRIDGPKIHPSIRCDILIFYGKDEQAMYDDLKSGVDSETRIYDRGSEELDGHLP